LRNTAKIFQVLIALDAASNLPPPPCSCVFTDAQLPCCVKRISELHQPFAANMVNTACRALAAEHGPLLMRAEASPPGGVTDGTRRRKRVKAAVSCGDGEVGDDPVVELIDAPPLPEAARLLRSDMDLAISGGGPECVVLVLRCDAPTKERNAAVKRLPEISAAVRAKGQSASRRFQNCPPCLVFVLFIVGRLFMRPDPHTYTRHHQPW
jgi:hypothetical protein